MAIFDAAMVYQKEQVPCVVVAGKEYGTGSSRDWAAKGSYLLGIKAVIAESYERIHRSNLVGMGVLPLQLPEGVTRKTLELKGDEQLSIDLSDALQSSSKLVVTIERSDGESITVTCLCRLDTPQEVAYYRRGGVLRYVLCNMMGETP